MGIPNLAKWLFTNITNFNVPHPPLSKNTKCFLYIDGNQLLYKSYPEMVDKFQLKFNATNYDWSLIANFLAIKYIRYVKKCIHDLILDVQHVYIMFDGVCLGAKMFRQRNSRFDQDDNKLKVFTAGTTLYRYFIYELNTQLKKHKLTELYTVNTVNEIGEGEIKIIQQLLLNQISYPTYYHIICSGDSDLIALSCLNKVCNTYIWTGISSFIDIHNLIDKLIILLQCENRTQLQVDFCFLTLLMSNDFLPKARKINIPTILAAYKILVSEKYYLIDVNTCIINWLHYTKLLQLLLPNIVHRKNVNFIIAQRIHIFQYNNQDIIIDDVVNRYLQQLQNNIFYWANLPYNFYSFYCYEKAPSFNSQINYLTKINYQLALLQTKTINSTLIKSYFNIILFPSIHYGYFEYKVAQQINKLQLHKISVLDIEAVHQLLYQLSQHKVKLPILQCKPSIANTITEICIAEELDNLTNSFATIEIT